MTDTYAYLGAQDQGTAPSDYNALVFVIRQEMAKLRTGVPAKVVRAPYDASGNPIPPGTVGPIGFIDVQPMVNQLDGYGNATSHGNVTKLSYHRYQSASGAFISDPVVGDIGQLHVADRDTSSVRATNDVSNPGSGRMHDLADSTFIGAPQAGTPTQYFAWTATGFSIGDKNGNTIVAGPGGVTINGTLTVKTNGDIVTKKGTDLDNHTHSGVTAGGDDTGPPVI